MSVIAAEQGRELAEIADEAGVQFFKSSSLKTALDLNWDNPLERQNALSIILNSLDSVEEWLQSQSDCENFEMAQETLDVARVIEASGGACRPLNLKGTKYSFNGKYFGKVEKLFSWRI